MQKKGIIVLGALLVASPAFADHGIENIESAAVDLLSFLFFGVFCLIAFVIFAILRFTLERPLLSVGTYVSAMIVLLFQLSNYIAAYEEYSNKLEYWKSSTVRGSPDFVNAAQQNLPYYERFFVIALPVLILYIVFDIKFNQKKKSKRMEEIEALEHSFKNEKA